MQCDARVHAWKQTFGMLGYYYGGLTSFRWKRPQSCKASTCRMFLLARAPLLDLSNDGAPELRNPTGKVKVSRVVRNGLPPKSSGFNQFPWSPNNSSILGPPKPILIVKGPIERFEGILHQGRPATTPPSTLACLLQIFWC